MTGAADLIRTTLIVTRRTVVRLKARHHELHALAAKRSDAGGKGKASVARHRKTKSSTSAGRLSNFASRNGIVYPEDFVEVAPATFKSDQDDFVSVPWQVY